MKAISGKPIKPKYALEIKDVGEKQIDLQFLQSDDLKIIEDGIREIRKGVNTGILAMGMGFLKIEYQAIYTQIPGCKSYMQYLMEASDRVDMPRSTISTYKRMAEIYFQNKSKLQRAGFMVENHTYKLLYLEVALETHKDNPEEVFKRIIADSVRQFKEYALGDSFIRMNDKPVQQYLPDIQITPKRIMVDGKNILRLDPDLDERTKVELADYLKQIYEVRATGNQPHIFNLYDEQEAKAVESFIKRHRKHK